jgi:hypothetical protein
VLFVVGCSCSDAIGCVRPVNMGEVGKVECVVLRDFGWVRGVIVVG